MRGNKNGRILCHLFRRSDVGDAHDRLQDSVDQACYIRGRWSEPSGRRTFHPQPSFLEVLGSGADNRHFGLRTQ